MVGKIFVRVKYNDSHRYPFEINTPIFCYVTNGPEVSIDKNSVTKDL